MPPKTLAERTALHLNRLQEKGGKRTTIDLSAETLAEIEEIKSRGKFVTTKEIVSEAVRRLARK